ncbi:MAG: acyl carrier protein [Crocinitomicaceae bacterium]|jgi:acyl carrier protein
MEKFIIDKIEEITFTAVSPSDSLWEEKVLDSITIIELVVELENEYNIKVPFNEIVTENFETVEQIVLYLKSKIG